jgi:peptidoglycan/LPS O-acetylase OafA/YrhL
VPQTIERQLQNKENGFDLLRLLAAILVIASHSYPLSGRTDEIFAQYFTYDTGGGFAVAAFFVISGLLITRSALENDGWDFLLARVLRLMPALLFVGVLQYLVIGPIFTVTPLSTYFKVEIYHPLRTATLFWNNFHLSGVFTKNIVTSVNGSLWTLPYEFVFYLWIFFATGLGILTKRSSMAITLLVVGFAVFLHSSSGLSFENQGGVLFKLSPFYSGIKSLSFFMMGSMLYFLRARIPLTAPLALSALILMMIAAGGQMAGVTYYLCFPYLIVYAGLKALPPLNLRHSIGDLSYGVYIVGFPMQQMIFELSGQSIRPTFLTLLAVPLSLGFAWISWRYVEAPALRIRYRYKKIYD